MGQRAIIRKGDPTSHGGEVIEGSEVDIVEGKPVAFVGHKVSCRKCRGTHEIVEGAPVTTFYGKGVALEGMKTSCGATLIATQFTTTVGYASGGGGDVSGKAALSAEQQAAAPIVGKRFVNADGELAIVTEPAPHEDPYDEQTKLVAPPIEGVPYYVKTMDGRTFSGRAAADGLLPRINTYGKDEYKIYWGDEALAKTEGGGA
jgi:uncharacterized Zn-binding protein involved in type VI secretion